MLLVTTAHPQMLKHAHRNLGRLIQPRHYPRIEDTARAGIPWAADNDCFQGYDDSAFAKMIDRIEGLPGCLFVVCPDVLCDHVETLALFRIWGPALRQKGLPLAFVLQNGCTPDGVPWSEIAAVFVGGDNEFKMSERAAELVREAKRRGLWAHMGRVNTWKRTKYAASIGCDSVDGTRNSRFRDTYLNRSLHEVSALVQGSLFHADK